MRNQKYRTE